MLPSFKKELSFPIRQIIYHHLRRRAPVEHGAQDLGGHDDAARVGVDGDIARHETDVLKFLA